MTVSSAATRRRPGEGDVGRGAKSWAVVEGAAAVNTKPNEVVGIFTLISALRHALRATYRPLPSPVASRVDDD